MKPGSQWSLLVLATSVACGSGGTPATRAASGSASGQSSGASAASGMLGSGAIANSSGGDASLSSGGEGAGAAGGGSSSGDTSASGISASGAASGGTSGSGSSGSTGATSGGVASGSSGGASTGVLVTDDGGVYAGKPFMGVMQQIPGFLKMANYDTGGPGVAYCHGYPPDCQKMVNTGDWRDYMGTYRPVAVGDTVCGGAGCNDNAGICHMNGGEPDNYAATSASWIAGGADGPTLTGPMVKIGTNVMPQDVYVCYMKSPTSGGGMPSLAPEWLRYTVEVTEPGTFAIGGFAGAPAGVTVTFDFGGEITSGTVSIPGSPTAGCNCPETYHSWQMVQNIGTVTIPAAGVYVLTFSLLTLQFNPDYFTFTKM
jgi:hypothetical protein